MGGGLGGLTAARVLERHGYKPLVFERDAHRGAREQGGTLDLHPTSGEHPRRLALFAVSPHSRFGAGGPTRGITRSSKGLILLSFGCLPALLLQASRLWSKQACPTSSWM